MPGIVCLIISLGLYLLQLIHISTDVSPRWGRLDILHVVQPLTKTNPHTTLVIRYIKSVDAKEYMYLHF